MFLDGDGFVFWDERGDGDIALRKGFRFSFPDDAHVKMEAVTPAGDMWVFLTWDDFVEVHKAVMQRRRERADLRECPVMVGEGAADEL